MRVVTMTIVSAVWSLGAASEVADRIIPPIVEGSGPRALVVLAAYAVTLALSGSVVQLIAVRCAKGAPPEAPTTTAATPPTADRRRQGMIIGKCENIITVTFVLAGQETGLALIFAAKSLVRRDDIQRDPGYYLGGTLVNLVWAMAVSFLARVLIAGL